MQAACVGPALLQKCGKALSHQHCFLGVNADSSVSPAVLLYQPSLAGAGVVVGGGREGRREELDGQRALGCIQPLLS